MNLAYPVQKFQDWFTQQWVIIWGRKFDPNDHPWLIGPFGNLTGIGATFAEELAEKEGWAIVRGSQSQGIIPSVAMLGLSDTDLNHLSQEVIQFYENTTDYDLDLSVKWNPFFKPFGSLVNRLFSKRIDQLNIPAKDIKNIESITSEIITLVEPLSNNVKCTIWLRTDPITGQVMYSGVYGTCTLPTGKVCVKAVFPLPKGNATVILSPRVGAKGELILESTGREFGDAGFYFLLNDSKGNHWAQYIRSFRDHLTVTSEHNTLRAEQTLTLWHLNVVKFIYNIRYKSVKD